MELHEAIRNRRSVRKFTDYVISDEEIKEILEAARWAPSWANVQPWEFIVIRDRELIKQVAATYSENNPALKATQASSAVIVVCAQVKKSGYWEGWATTKHGDWMMFDVGMAAQNLCLKAHELGLGGVVVGLLDHDKCAELVSLPEGRELIACIPLGKPAVDRKGGPPRNEVSDFTHKDRFGNKYFI